MILYKMSSNVSYHAEFLLVKKGYSNLLTSPFNEIHCSKRMYLTHNRMKQMRDRGTTPLLDPCCHYSNDKSSELMDRVLRFSGVRAGALMILSMTKRSFE